MNDKKQFNTIRKILLTTFVVVAILAFVSACGTILNYLLEFSPSKISNEFETSMIFAGIALFISSASLFLFYGLFNLKKWFPGLYWIIILSYIFPVMLMLGFSNADLNHFIENSIFIIFGLLLPLALGVYLLIKDEFFKKKNVSGV